MLVAFSSARGAHLATVTPPSHRQYPDMPSTSVSHDLSQPGSRGLHEKDGGTAASQRLRTERRSHALMCVSRGVLTQGQGKILSHANRRT